MSSQYGSAEGETENLLMKEVLCLLLQSLYTFVYVAMTVPI